MPLQSTSGAASYDAFGGGVAAVPKYIEDYFSTFLYTATGSAQTITNNIDLSTKGGLVWFKRRNTTSNHRLYDTARGMISGTGGSPYLYSNDTAGNLGTGFAASVTASTTGFNITTDGSGIGDISDSGGTYTSWTLAKVPKFFDVVTYTGNGVNGRAISHNLGSTPGFIVVKCTSAASQWTCWHRAYNSGNGYGYLNDTTAWFNTGADVWGNGTTYTAPTSTTFTVNAASGLVNDSSATYVAYLFAHDAGGFGLTGTDNVISCGSYTGNSSYTGPVINLGYEPQWVMIKNVTTGGYSWSIYDNMRGIPTGPNDAYLLANTSDAEQGTTSGTNEIDFQATGFQLMSPSYRYNASGDTYIYIAIRRGPMKVPTSGTSVFNPVLGVSTAPAFRSSNFNSGVDSGINFYKPGYPGYSRWSSRLTGTGVIPTSATDAESAISATKFDYMNGFYNQAGLDGDFGAWMFKRAPGFHDQVCYTGTGSTRTVTHNLGVVPELMIVKVRNDARDWLVYSSGLTTNYFIKLNTTAAQSNSNYAYIFGNDTVGVAPTSSVFTVGSGSDTNGSGGTYVAYLFATCAGVSKVGSYTGTATTKQIDCGFTAGARFILIKRTDSTGDWYVWDSARGIVSGNDPYFLLNTDGAEVTNTDYIDTYSAGFEISSTAPAAINASGGNYIFLAIA